MSDSDASSSAEATFFPFASIKSAVCTIVLPVHMAEREATEAKPVRPRLVSPCWCSILCGSMPRCWPSSRANTVAWLCPVDCTLQPRISLSSPGKATEAKLLLGCNVQSTGQSHATVFARLLGQHLGIDPHKIEHRHGDTNLGLTGFASVE